MGFLRCYLARKAEFEHSKRKRVAYANILEDMVSLGITVGYSYKKFNELN